MNGKEIIFRVNELSNKENTGWIPYAKPIKMFILDYISKESADQITAHYNRDVLYYVI